MLTYGARDNFLLIFHVDRQEELTRDVPRCFFGKAPTLSQVNAAYGKGTSEEWLTYQLANISEYSGARGKIGDPQIEEMAKLITNTWHWLKVSEVMLFFRWFKLGKYGQFYGSFDPLIMMTAMRSFLRERNDMYARKESQETLEADRRMRAEAVPMDEVQRRLASGMYPNLKKYLDGKKKVVVYFKINDMARIRKVMAYFGMSGDVTVNGETRCVVRDDKMMELLKQAEKDGIIQIRYKQ